MTHEDAFAHVSVVPEGYKVHAEKRVVVCGLKMVRMTLWRIGWNKKGGHRDELIRTRHTSYAEEVAERAYKPDAAFEMLRAMLSGREIKITHGDMLKG